MLTKHAVNIELSWLWWSLYIYNKKREVLQKVHCLQQKINYIFNWTHADEVCHCILFFQHLESWAYEIKCLTFINSNLFHFCAPFSCLWTQKHPLSESYMMVITLNQQHRAFKRPTISCGRYWNLLLLCPHSSLVESRSAVNCAGSRWPGLAGHPVFAQRAHPESSGQCRAHSPHPESRSTHSYGPPRALWGSAPSWGCEAGVCGRSRLGSDRWLRREEEEEEAEGEEEEEAEEEAEEGSKVVGWGPWISLVLAC